MDLAILSRREAVALIGATAAAAAAPGHAFTALTSKKEFRMLTCFIRYQIDPFQREAFGQYAANWGKIIPRCGGDLVGYFLPKEGTNDVAFGLISFESLASYEAYRQRLQTDPDSLANFSFAQKNKLVLREERTFLDNVPGTIGIARSR